MSSAPPLDPPAFAAAFATAAQAAGFRGETFGEVAGHPLVAFTRPAPGAPAIYVSAGVHGDEPAAPHALLELVATGAFDGRASWFLCPLLNPTGFIRGTRENHDGIDLNRDYLQPSTREVSAHVAWLRRQPRFAASFCLHEDYEARGFYLYELNPDARPSLADAILAAAARHCPIEDAAVIDGRPAAAPGIIRPESDPLLRDRWPEAIYLRHHHTGLSYTFESPSPLPLSVRIAALAAALRAALDRMLGA